MRYFLFLSILLIAASPASAEDKPSDHGAITICQFRGGEPGFVEPCLIIMEAEQERRSRRSEASLKHDLDVVKRAAKILKNVE